MRRALRVCVILLLSGVAWLAGLGGAHAYALRMATPDGPRDVIVLPARRGPAPTVIVLHGIAISASWTSQISGFAEAARDRGFTSVYPEGIKSAWNDGREGVTSGADDVGFLRRLVHELVQRGISDPARIYITGISNGGMMALRMLCEASELFAGVGTTIANMPARTGTTCRIAHPVPVVMVNGSADLLVPYNGGWVGPFGIGGNVWGTEKTAAFLARANGCATVARTESPVGKSGGSASITRTAWRDCIAPDKHVTLYRVNGGGHQIYGRRGAIASLMRSWGPDISAAETIMAAFVKEGPRPRRERVGARGTPGQL
jgi:polyhydroxybutyrate depolymerase